MPWHAIIKRGNRYLVRGRNTRRILGRQRSRKKAVRQLRAIEASMRGD